MLQQFGVCLLRWAKHKHTRVEAVGPAGVRSSRELLPVKQLVDIGQHLGRSTSAQGEKSVAAVTPEPKSHHRVRVHEDTFGEMRESPAVEFGEGDPQFRPLHHGQVRRVAAVQHVHHQDIVKDPPQHGPEGAQGSGQGGRGRARPETGQRHLTGKARTPPDR